MKTYLAFIFIFLVSSAVGAQSLNNQKEKIAFEKINYRDNSDKNIDVSAIIELNDRAVLKSLDGHYSEAVDLFTQALKISSDIPTLQHNLGQTLLRQENNLGALKVFKNLTETYPKYANGYHGLGEALFRLKNYNESIKAYENTLNLTPNDPLALNNLGDALYQTGHYESAVDVLNKAIRLKPDFVHARNNRAVSLIKLGRYKEALADLNHALSLDNSLAETHNNLGILYDSLNDSKKAYKYFLEAVRLKPAWSVGIYNLALSYLEMRKLDKVREFQNQLSKLDKELAEELNKKLLEKHLIRVSEKNK